MAKALNNMPAIMRLNSGMRDVIYSDCKGAGFRGRVRRAGAVQPLPGTAIKLEAAQSSNLEQ